MAIGINLGDDDYDDDSTGSMFGPRRGSWSLYSKSDPRWNCSGDAMVGGFVMPSECETAFKQLKEKFGEPPKDLEWSYMKD